MRAEQLTLREAFAKKNKTQLILSNGSERGDYVDCVAMQKKFTSPHQGIQLMKTFYPNNPKWTTRDKISLVHPNPEVRYAWDYDYDDYHPLDVFEIDSASMQQCRQIKLIGADIHLTLTIDTELQDEQLIKIFEKLKPFGLVYLRINHEANGTWFTHNKRSSYKQVSDFFVRCHRLIQIYAPNVKTVFSLTGDIFVGNQIQSRVTHSLARLGLDQLGEALAIADYWSIDKYVSLNWGWPHTHPSTSDQFFLGTVDTWWRLIEETYLLMINSNQGCMKPLFLHEFNSDADVVGDQGQVDAIAEVYNRILSSDFPWLEGICFYQFCDEGGLGLVKKTKDVLTPTPAFKAYESVIKNLSPQIETTDCLVTDNVFTFEWKTSLQIKGINVSISDLETNTVYRRKFMNSFSQSIYVVDSKGWFFVEPESEVDLSDSQFYIFIPPFFDQDNLIFSTEENALKQKIMIGLVN